MEYVIFKLINENFAIRLDQIKEILVYDQIILTPLFTEQPWIKGVINLRGEVIPIVDLRIRFNQENPNYDDNTVAIVVKTDEDKLIGIVVDNIEKILPIQKSQVSQTYDMEIGIDSKYLLGLVKLNQTQMTVLLDIDSLLKIEELV
ncbi:MAG: purine-binding chemotaxis protein CheW [Epsilonproteobacteria bacterium]|nr:purine-binding chemotaxis protein CheW [Campylobacterota bacterium]